MTVARPALALGAVLAAAVVALTAPRGARAFSPPPRGPGAWERTSPTALRAAEARGCAARPLEKKKVAVFGAGGYLGATLFGFLQRAGSLYGTGIAGGSSPRAICATSGGAEALNKVLAAAFKLSYAGEDLIRLADTSDAGHMADRLRGFDAAVLGTTYQLERRRVTLGTFEKSPMDTTYELYLGGRYGAFENNVPDDDDPIHATIFRDSVRACRDAGLSHLVVVETPRTADPATFVQILEEEDVPYTYLRTMAALEKDKFYTFEKGIANRLRAAEVTAVSSETLLPFDERRATGEEPVRQEDLAAMVVQCLLTLDWGSRRILQVSAEPDASVSSGYGARKPPRGQRFDREWCPNSELLADALSGL